MTGETTATTTATSPVSVTYRPTLPSTVVAVVAALTSLWALGAARDSTMLLGAAGVGLVTLGLWVGWRWTRALGFVLGVLGIPLVAAAVVFAWTGVARATVFATVAPALVGALLVTIALAPGRGDSTRTLLKAGSGFVFLAVLVAGVTQLADFDALLLSGVAAVVAWDAGETAVNVGEQLGQEPTTWPVEAAHLAGTLVVGAVTVALGRVAQGLGTPGLPLTQFAFLLVAVVVLAAALHE
ncbi:DUF7519 family protein [Haloarchaeobius amylolyticus]|uniref:DUF7519 family protein n=1 Tax=Haloarchaeobius amylolyticus TaxID=1198296 RepID=UPI002270CA82|nr:hypothetical protein [Haloarchaeobius amylolyticus]